MSSSSRTLRDVRRATVARPLSSTGHSDNTSLSNCDSASRCSAPVPVTCVRWRKRAFSLGRRFNDSIPWSLMGLPASHKYSRCRSLGSRKSSWSVTFVLFTMIRVTCPFSLRWISAGSRPSSSIAVVVNNSCKSLANQTNPPTATSKASRMAPERFMSVTLGGEAVGHVSAAAIKLQYWKTLCWLTWFWYGLETVVRTQGNRSESRGQVASAPHGAIMRSCLAARFR